MASSSSDDTDILLALLASSLDDGTQIEQFEQFELLNALVEAGGDVPAAVSLLKQRFRRKTDSHRPNKKRKSGLDHWLNNKKKNKTNEVDQEDLWEDDSHLLGNDDPSKQASTSKAPNSLMGILQQAAPNKQPVARPAPTTLSVPSMISRQTPTSLHPSILPPELACRLFYAMLDEAENWTNNKWYLADRLVESPHTTSFYARAKSDSERLEMQEPAQFWYNGRVVDPPLQFPAAMEEACTYVEDYVRQQILSHRKYPLEWGGDPVWSANVAAANCYRGGKEGVGFHADSLTYLGPYPTIASLSLGATRTFRLREVIPKTDNTSRQAQTFNIPLTHNSLLLMHPPTQEHFKHTVPTVKSIDVFRPPFPRHPGEEIKGHVERINITFRFFRPDYSPSSIPRCSCKGGTIPAVLKSNMKRRGTTDEASFFWMCNGGAQNEGKGCKFWRTMNAEGEGRGPFVGTL